MERFRSASWRRIWPAGRDRLLLVWIVLLSSFIVFMAGRNLGDFSTVSGDDAWIMSASHKLATEGVFGSDMFRGFANAEHRYFIALPVYHFLQAGVFAVFDTSIAAARAVTLASGLVTLWCVAWLARRWHGVAVAVVATGLLVFWRAYLMNLASGLSFISVSRTGRYDATAVAFVMLSLVGFEQLRYRERRWLAVGTGAMAGLATLTQFFGALVVPLIAVLLFVERGWSVYREPAVRWLATGWLVVVLPYVLYAAAYWSDFTAQSELKAGRIEFGRPSFYLDNLLDEPDRYRHLFSYLRPALDGQYHLFDQPISPLLFGVAAILAFGFLALRALRGLELGERSLAIAIAVPWLCLALLDGTNAPLYTVVLLPFACIAIALLAVTSIRWAVRQPSLPLGVAVCVLVLAPGIVVVREGIAAHRQEYEWSNEIIRYQDASAEINAVLPDGAPVLGMERWWAGLYQDHEYIAIAAITRQIEPGRELGLLLDRYGFKAIVIDDDARGLLGRLPAAQRNQFEELIRSRADYAGTVTLQVYGHIDIYVID